MKTALLALVIICTVFEFTAFSWDYQHELFQEVSEGRLAEHAKVMDFFHGGRLPSDLTAAEEEHMHDVRRLHRGFESLLGGMTVGAFVALCFGNVPAILRRLWLPLIVLVALGGIVALIPSYTFTAFHYVFFPQGGWRFPAGSKLLSLYPPAYFGQLVLDVFIRSLISMLAVAGIGHGLERWKPARDKH